MLGSVLGILKALLEVIPILHSWLKKSTLEKENKGKVDVDQEHEKGKEERRPSSDFWKDRSP